MSNGYLQRARSGALATFGARILETAISFVVAAAIIRHLTPEQFGSYQIFLAIAATASFIVSVGGPSIAGRYVPEFIERRQSKNLVVLTVGLIVMRLVGLVVFVTILYAANDWIADLFNFTDFLRDWTLVILLYAAVSQMGQIVGPVLLGAYFEQSKLGIIQAIGSAVRLVIIISLIQLNQGLGGIITGLLGLEVGLAIVYGWVLLRVVRSTTAEGEQDSSEFPKRRVFRFALPTLPLPLFGLFRSNYSDAFVISHWLGIQSVGVYAFAFMVLRMGSSLNPVFFLNMQIEHALVRSSITGDRVKVLARGHRILFTATFAIVLPVALVIALIRDELALSFGFANTNVSSVMIIAAVYAVINALRLAYGNIFTVMEAMKYRVYSETFAVYNLVAAIALVRVWGIEGVAIATTTAAGFTLIYEHYVSTRRIGIPLGIHPREILMTLVNGGISSAVLAVLRTQLPDGIPGLLLGVSLFFAIYGALTLVLRPVHPEDWDLLKKLVLKKPVGGAVQGEVAPKTPGYPGGSGGPDIFTDGTTEE